MFSSNAFATETALCPETLYRLASYAFPFDRTRTESDLQFWKDYKAKPDTREFDMRVKQTQPIAAPLPWYEALVNENRVHPKSPRPSNYEITLLVVRQGSKLIYDSEILTLGKFLGAGNSSHIYQLADRPEIAVRLPFAADAGPMYKRSSRMQQAQELTEYYRAKRPSHHRFYVVKIIDSGEPKDFTLVEYIDVKTTALDFLNNISQKDRSLWTPEEKHLLHSVREFYLDFSGVTLNLDTLGSKELPRGLRQWGWSESRQNWVLLDWE